MDVNELIERIDLAEYVSQYTDLEVIGNELWGLSPLKDEKTPSFSIRNDSNIFYDFSSGQGGTVINFVMAYNNCSFGKAIEILKRYAGITEDVNAECVTQLEATKIAKMFRTKEIKRKESNPRILPDDYMSRYKWDKRKLKPWFDEGISWGSMEKFMVRYDQFSNRIVFPIRDMQGRIINVSGRTLDPDYKQKKLRKYTYFNGFGGGLNTLYGFYENQQSIKNKGEIILFEGAKSVLKADSWGTSNSAAVLTSHLSQFQMEQLIKLGVDVVVGFDEGIDIPSDKRIRKLIPYVKVYYMFDFDRLLDDKDAPVDKGKDVFEQLYANKRRLL